MQRICMPLGRHKSWLWVTALWTLIQLPYLGNSFRIDDPYHIEAARQIRRDPGDPYGFEINWDGSPKPAFVTYASPPLVPAWLALWRCFLPESETSLHLAMLPFSLLSLVTFGALASRFDVSPLLAMTLLACSPAFFLGSQVLMPDLPMLCFFLIAVAGACWYWQDRSRLAAVLAFVAAALCPLAKYNGAVVIPVLLCVGLTGRKGPQKELGVGCARSHRLSHGHVLGLLTVAAAPVISLACWGAFTWKRYGAVHFLSMTAFQRGQAHSLDPAMLSAGILGAFGLGVVPLSLLSVLSAARGAFVWLSALALCSGAAATGVAVLKRHGGGSAALFGFAAAVAVYVLAWVAGVGWQAAKTRDGNRIMLVVWILVGLAFQFGLMFSAVRYLLFLAPPVILLTLLRSSSAPRRVWLAAVVGLNLLFVIVLGLADARQASIYPVVLANAIRPHLERSGGNFYFDGHWGFQYYAERLGGKPIDEQRPPRYRAGDVVVVAKMPWPKLMHPLQAQGWDIEAKTLAASSSWWLRTVSCGAGANFYASVLPECERPAWLPFGFSRDFESFAIYTIREPGAPGKSVSGPLEP